MKKSTQNIIKWIPVLLSAAFACFIGLFALDILMENYTCRETLTGFLIHLRLVYILLIVTLIAWKWRIIGGLAFMAIGVHYVYTMYGKFPVITTLSIAGPLFLIGFLFILNRLIISRASDKKENSVAYWTLLLITAMFTFSEIVIFSNTGEFPLVYAGLLTVIIAAVFLYRIRPKNGAEKK